MRRHDKRRLGTVRTHRTITETTRTIRYAAQNLSLMTDWSRVHETIRVCSSCVSEGILMKLKGSPNEAETEIQDFYQPSASLREVSHKSLRLRELSVNLQLVVCAKQIEHDTNKPKNHDTQKSKNAAMIIISSNA